MVNYSVGFLSLFGVKEKVLPVKKLQKWSCETTTKDCAHGSAGWSLIEDIYMIDMYV